MGVTSPPPLRALDVDRFERLTAARGAESDVARAAMLQVSRVTIRRWRLRLHEPDARTTTRVCRALGATVDELFPVVEQ